MKTPEASCGDHVDHIRAGWAEAWPELDTSPIEVVARVGRAARFLDAGIERELRQHGLTRESFDVLAALRRAGAPYRLSPTELYRELMRTSGAMTARLRRLEEDGLITRAPDPADARGLLVVLTPPGRRLVERAAPAHLANERALLAELTDDEQQRLAALLRRLLSSFEAQPG